MGRFRLDLCAKGIWYSGKTGAMVSLRMLLSDASFCTLLFRVASALNRWRLSLLSAIVYKLNAFLTGAVIGRKAEFGPGLVILHGVGVVINGSVQGGTNVIIESGVVIGAEKGVFPVIGDNVFIGSGAKILGNVRVGNGARIGANAVVVHDVPDNATAVGVPATIVKVRT